MIAVDIELLEEDQVEVDGRAYHVLSFRGILESFDREARLVARISPADHQAALDMLTRREFGGN